MPVHIKSMVEGQSKCLCYMSSIVKVGGGKCAVGTEDSQSLSSGTSACESISTDCNQDLHNTDLQEMLSLSMTSRWWILQIIILCCISWRHCYLDIPMLRMYELSYYQDWCQSLLTLSPLIPWIQWNWLYIQNVYLKAIYVYFS